METMHVAHEALDIPLPDYENIITEDETPVDNLFSERQMALLKDSLYASWPGPGDNRPFVAMANVGLFFTDRAEPLVPDVLVSLDVEPPPDPWPKENRSYFIWRYGKPPDVVIEIVSNRKGGELGNKLLDYARLGVAYYIVYDPERQLSEQPLRIFGRQQRTYVELHEHWLADVGLGVTLWQGSYQGIEETWLRWCMRNNDLLLTGAERAEQEHQRAERLAAQLRALGVDPDA